MASSQRVTGNGTRNEEKGEEELQEQDKGETEELGVENGQMEKESHSEGSNTDKTEDTNTDKTEDTNTDKAEDTNTDKAEDTNTDKAEDTNTDKAEDTNTDKAEDTNTDKAEDTNTDELKKEDSNTITTKECHKEPNMAVVCSFWNEFSTSAGLPSIPSSQLEDMLEHPRRHQYQEALMEIHVNLMRKFPKLKAIKKDRWQFYLAKFCKLYMAERVAWEIDAMGYEKCYLTTRIDILKNLLEGQFDYSTKLKSDVNTKVAGELRLLPLGRDVNGLQYWLLQDGQPNVRVYREEVEDEEGSSWQLLVDDKSSLVKLIAELAKCRDSLPKTGGDSSSAPSECGGIDSCNENSRDSFYVSSRTSVACSVGTPATADGRQSDEEESSGNKDGISIERKCTRLQEKKEPKFVEVQNQGGLKAVNERDLDLESKTWSERVEGKMRAVDVDVKQEKEESDAKMQEEKATSLENNEEHSKQERKDEEADIKGEIGNKKETGKLKVEEKSESEEVVCQNQDRNNKETSETTPKTPKFGRKGKKWAKQGMEVTPTRRSARQCVLRSRIDEEEKQNRIEEEKQALAEASKRRERMESRRKEKEDRRAWKTQQKLRKIEIRNSWRRKKEVLAEQGRYGASAEKEELDSEEEFLRQIEEAHRKDDDDKLVLGGSDHEFSAEENDSGEEYVPRFAKTAGTRANGKKNGGGVATAAADQGDEDKPCMRCKCQDHPEWILLCDDCDNGWHTACLRPPLLVIPHGRWYCPPCEHKMLCEKLAAALKLLEGMMAKNSRLVKRQERLAFVNINVSNIIEDREQQRSSRSSKKRQSFARRIMEDSEEEEYMHRLQDSDSTSGSNESRTEQSESSSSSFDEEAEEEVVVDRSKTLRRSRPQVNYKFEQFESTIFEAIKDELEAAKDRPTGPPPGRSRGKDIANITGMPQNEEEEEERRRQQKEKEKEEEKENEEEKGEEGREELEKEEGKEVDTEMELLDGPPPPVVNRRKSKKARKKLRDLDWTDEEDDDGDDADSYHATSDEGQSDLSGQASASDDEDLDDEDLSDEDYKISRRGSKRLRRGRRQSTGRAAGRGSKRKKKSVAEKRSSTRKRTRNRRFAKDFVVGTDEETDDEGQSKGDDDDDDNYLPNRRAAMKQISYADVSDSDMDDEPTESPAKKKEASKWAACNFLAEKRRRIVSITDSSDGDGDEKDSEKDSRNDESDDKGKDNSEEDEEQKDETDEDDAKKDDSS